LRNLAQAKAAGLVSRERRQLGPPARGVGDEGPLNARAEAARILGVPGHQLRPARDARPGRPRSAPQPPLKLTSWQGQFFLPAEAAAWQAAGLGLEDGRLAADLTAQGITPADLGLRIRGRRAAEMLRGGELKAMVIADLLALKAAGWNGCPSWAFGWETSS
jgi:hypothetical protein